VDPARAGAADISFVAGRVEMAIDGLGLKGRSDHTVEETADLTMLPVQAKRAALLLHRLAVSRTPPSSDTEPPTRDSREPGSREPGLPVPGSPDDPEMAEAIRALLSDTSAHMRMAPHRHATRADSARAADVVLAARQALAKYRDVAVAEADGFVRFLPQVKDQPEYHYTNYRNALAEMFAFDATRPTSLLYREDARGALQLVGVMYSAPWRATPDQLDARLPLGMAHWHQHVNFCGPRPVEARRVRDRRDVAAVARWLRITSREDCLAAGGRFTPRVFGWMAHAYIFAGDDPKVIWGDGGKAKCTCIERRVTRGRGTGLRRPLSSTPPPVQR
jgi:hypothetical protein